MLGMKWKNEKLFFFLFVFDVVPGAKFNLELLPLQFCQKITDRFGSIFWKVRFHRKSSFPPLIYYFDDLDHFEKKKFDFLKSTKNFDGFITPPPLFPVVVCFCLSDRF